MGERWVCKRCFSANEDSAGTCATCGLARGSEVPAGEAMAPAASAKRGGAWWTGLLRFWWIAVVAVVGISGAVFSASRDDSGQISDAGDLQAFDLRAGDCFDLKDPDEELIEQVEAKPCTEVHEFEMFLVADMADGGYPSVEAMDDFVLENCVPAFGEFVGRDYELSVLDIFWLTPTEESWTSGDRAIQCAVFHPTNAELTSSLRGSGR